MSKHDASKKADVGASAEHRLFHAIVLMGSSMALGCGGTVTDGTADDDSSDGGSNGSGSSGSGGSGSGSGGRATSGGTPGAGGFQPAPPEAGGSPSTGGNGGVVTPSLPCPPGQWRCSADTLRCDYDVRGYELPTDCVCDPDLPLDGKDCGPGRILACDLGVSLPDGPRLDEPVPFDCTCVDAATSCDVACQGLRGSSREERSCIEEREMNGMVQYLCGCAVVVLR